MFDVFYVDAECHCHTNNLYGTFREIKIDPKGVTGFFVDKCETFIDGYCYDDGNGYVQIYPWKPYDELDAAQREYERQLLAEYEAALAEIEAALGV